MSEIKNKISNLLYNISVENRAAADRELETIMKLKIKGLLDSEYEKVKASFSQEKN
jgi:hypothetical protein